MDNQIANINREIGEIRTKQEATDKKVESLEKIIDVVYELTTSVKVLTEKLDTMNDNINDIKENTSKDISSIKGEIDGYHHKEPNKIIFNVKNLIITTIVAAIAGAYLSLILK